MVKLNLALAAAIVAHGAIAATVDEQSLFANLLKRQEPGTPKYKCHEACGGAILAARAAGDDVCKDDAFLSNYNSCLKCAGPGNFDIWNIYGRTLSGFGESCGLSTTPEAGNSGGAESTTPAAPTSTEAAEPSITSSVADPTTTPDQATTASPEPTSSGPAEPGHFQLRRPAQGR
ncbi:hypothetical protein NUW58_g950 [Xylaria curta]|uniref:Uncharacterized protein n=1 Tax=Xylaria curta TaxID=42375 RepID=A0ACC1PQ22_9PEZI|nr:hypothetical protein NUW58_g950 [Xylaria curta]